ncbi:hypothetical protein O181_128403 [Austropuccinia psidii MF-1]|uniref:Uncharacterized protein n=1 Tax=Austropuccinia psidii MF-1 TaxID=1389203 RepID=A0A9Q3KUW1_9BASI|nr:hypothetical protein [Austropuccinia psidii MF-1]
MASCPYHPSPGNILPSLALLDNSPPHQPPGHYPCFWAWGLFSLPGAYGPSSPPPGPLAQPLILWGFGLNSLFGPFRPPTASTARGPQSMGPLGPFWPKSNGSKGAKGAANQVQTTSGTT